MFSFLACTSNVHACGWFWAILSHIIWQIVWTADDRKSLPHLLCRGRHSMVCLWERSQLENKTGNPMFFCPYWTQIEYSQRLVLVFLWKTPLVCSWFGFENDRYCVIYVHTRVSSSKQGQRRRVARCVQRTESACHSRSTFIHRKCVQCVCYTVWYTYTCV